MSRTLIGKLSLVAVVALIVLGVISARIAGNFALFVMAGLATAILFGFVGLILYWAKKNPELAATEGSAYVESQRLGLAAKGLLPPPVLAIGPDPQHPTLLTEAKEVAELDG